MWPSWWVSVYTAELVSAVGRWLARQALQPRTACNLIWCHRPVEVFISSQNCILLQSSSLQHCSHTVAQCARVLYTATHSPACKAWCCKAFFRFSSSGLLTNQGGGTLVWPLVTFKIRAPLAEILTLAVQKMLFLFLQLVNIQLQWI